MKPCRGYTISNEWELSILSFWIDTSNADSNFTALSMLGTLTEPEEGFLSR